jgi:ATP-dependent Clp protease protease subunit
MSDDVMDDLLSGSGVAPNSDRIWVHEFDEHSAQQFSDKVMTISERDPFEPVAVYIDSYGGEADGLATMISMMDAVPNPFLCIATGKAMSAGAILLSHGDVRCVGLHARVMIHEVSGGAGGNINDIANQTNELHRLNDYFMDLLAKNCGKTRKQLQNVWAKYRDTYMDANSAVRFGIADHVGIPTIVKHTRYDLKFPHPPQLKVPNEAGRKPRKR